MSASMYASVGLLAPLQGLAIEIIQIAEDDPCPIAVLKEFDGILDLAFGLRSVSTADPWGDAYGGHEIGKVRIPARLFLFHF
jgi:hypothetical protein